MADTIYVKAGPGTPKGRVALWEVDPQHPKSDEFPEGGEVFIAGDKVVKVATTSKVNLRLRNDQLVQVDGPSGKKTKAAEGS